MPGDFLFLSLLCLLPGGFIFCLRRDLRKAILTISACAIPFAFTESLFYPSYWEPHFLWNLVEKIGFGVEDIIFIVGIGALTSSAYPFFFKKRFSETASKKVNVSISRVTIAFFAIAVLVFLAVIIKIPMIYGSVGVMLLISAGIVSFRTDLLLPSVYGGVITCMIYTLICLVLSIVFKDIFRIVWHGEKFSGIYIAGVLLEEYLYSFSAGVAGTIFYPFVTGKKFI